MSQWIKSNVTLENTTTSNPASMSVAQYGSTFKVGRKVSSTFRVHVQTVSFATIVGSHVMVTDGNVKGVTAGDVVTQRFPVHCDQTRPGLSNLQPFRSSHRFYKIREERRSVISIHVDIDLYFFRYCNTLIASNIWGSFWTTAFPWSNYVAKMTKSSVSTFFLTGLYKNLFLHHPCQSTISQKQ